MSTATHKNTAFERGNYRKGVKGYMRVPLEQRFWKYVYKTTDCWFWTGIPNANGYGQIKVNGRFVVAHRVSWGLANGDIPKGLLVLHSCDTRQCVNPAHLFLGTKSSNAKDAFSKGTVGHFGVSAIRLAESE